MANRSKFLMTATLAVAMTMSGTASADAMTQKILDENHVSEGAMLMDALIARPLLLATTAVGAGLFIVAAPFTLAGGTTGQTWDALVATPASATFVRCLGCTPTQNDRERAKRRLARADQQ